MPDGWRAYGSSCANGCPPRATHHRPSPPDGDARRNPIDTRAPAITIKLKTMTYVLIGRPRGRLIRAAQDSPPTTAPAAPQAKTHVARRRGRRGGSQPRCARGNLKERPKALTKMTTGQSGANAPDRNRGREPPRRTRRRATYEEDRARSKNAQQTVKIMS